MLNNVPYLAEEKRTVLSPTSSLASPRSAASTPRALHTGTKLASAPVVDAHTSSVVYEATFDGCFDSNQATLPTEALLMLIYSFFDGERLPCFKKSVKWKISCQYRTFEPAINA